MIVKVCGITNMEDALAAAEAGASAIGFNFYPKSPRYISRNEAAMLAGRLPRHVWRVGVFVNERPDVVLDIALHVPLDVVQIHGRTKWPAGVRVWKALSVGPDFQREILYEYSVEAFLLDAPSGARYGGTGRTYDWARVAGLPGKIVLAGGLDEQNVADAVRMAQPWGVDACSRLESAPGKKDLRRMEAFIKAALAAQTEAAMAKNSKKGGKSPEPDGASPC